MQFASSGCAQRLKPDCFSSSRSQMIRPLRHLHRCQAVVLGVILPVTFVLGIAARKSAPTLTNLPPALAALSPAPGDAVGERDHLFTKAPVSVRLWHQQNNSNLYSVSFSAPADFIKPDLMVYWIPGSSGFVENLPTNAVLLGAFGPQALPLSDDIASGRGELVLYSLADGEIVDTSQPIRLDQVSPSSSIQ